MQDYAFDSPKEMGRDILRELDAGELDEEYLIKHASDYGRCTTTSQLHRAWQNISAKFLNLTTRFPRPKHVSQTMKSISRSASH